MQAQRAEARLTVGAKCALRAKLPKTCAEAKVELARVRKSLAFPCHPVVFLVPFAHKEMWSVNTDHGLWRGSLTLSFLESRTFSSNAGDWDPSTLVFYFLLVSLSHATPHWGVSFYLSASYLSICLSLCLSICQLSKQMWSIVLKTADMPSAQDWLELSPVGCVVNKNILFYVGIRVFYEILYWANI